MQNMKMKASDKNGDDEKNCEFSKQKERHIVSWSPEEDEILREQIRIYGTDNWTNIASKFKDKTTRQCRRRWYTYLNSDFKKGGWSPEEDMLLCEAQKIFGNRWTEIAKVVSGRTDNAVKNRFTTLCKKKAKYDALAKENNASFNLHNKRVIFQNGLNIDRVIETAAPFKKMRSHISNISENHDVGGKLIGECARINQFLRPPFAELAQNLQHGDGNLKIQQQVNNASDAADNKGKGIYLKKDDPKILALVQQAELLSSLALKVNSESSDQSLENAWKVLQNYLSQTKEKDAPKFENPSRPRLENFKDLVEDSRSSNVGSRPSLRQPDLDVTSPSSSEYSTGSTLLCNAEYEKLEHGQTHQDIEAEQESHIGGQNGSGEGENEISCDGNSIAANKFPASGTIQEGGLCENSDMGFRSPIQVTPLFRSLAAAIPSPKFSESERHFLLKTLGLESASPNPSAIPSKSPSCKRVLLHSL